jgi:hypothetical protein
VFYQGKPMPMNMAGDAYHEDYDVRNPSTANVDVCCRTGAPVSGKLPEVDCARATRRDASTIVEAGVTSDARAPGAGRDASLAEGGSSVAEGGAPRDAGIGEGGDSGPGPKGAEPAAILCTLWTYGPAKIVVTGTKYPELETEWLTVHHDECGSVTRDIRLVWSQFDGGK